MILLCFLLASLASFEGAGEALEYRREFMLTQPWRWVSAHFVHLGPWHATWNIIGLGTYAWWVKGRVAPQEIVLTALLAMCFISSAFWLFHPEISWYRGLSGVLHALLVLGIVRTVHSRVTSSLALVIVASKVAWDCAAAPSLAYLSSTPILVESHAYGAIAGLSTVMMRSRVHSFALVQRRVGVQSEPRSRWINRDIDVD